MGVKGLTQLCAHCTRSCICILENNTCCWTFFIKTKDDNSLNTKRVAVKLSLISVWNSTELCGATRSCLAGSLAKLSLEEVKKLRKVEHCILEAIRLRPAGMIARKLTGPMQVREFTIPAGDMLMISPYWAHQNEAIYPDARSYVPERWNQTVGSDKSAPSDKFFAFGGGRFQCPGRRFAMMEIQMFISLLLCSFDLELVKEEVPLPSPRHVVGVPHPLSPCYVKMLKRVRTVW